MATLNGDPSGVIAQHLRPNTRLVVVYLWNTGQVLSMLEIVKVCRQHDCSTPVRILVDAAQSVGSLPLNLTGWGRLLCLHGSQGGGGPAGVGGLCTTGSTRKFAATFIGWRSTDTEGIKPVGWQPDGRQYEVTSASVCWVTGCDRYSSGMGNRSVTLPADLPAESYLWRLTH